MSGSISHDEIENIAVKISDGPLGLVNHQPEPWALATACFANVWRKMELCEGRARYGWTFHSRVKKGIGDYLFVTHHTVWNRPDGLLFDITSFHDDARHHPLTVDGSVLFLVDDKAEPIAKGTVVAPLPLRFFPRGNGPQIARYVQEMNDNERQRLAALVDRLNRQSLQE